MSMVIAVTSDIDFRAWRLMLCCSLCTLTHVSFAYVICLCWMLGVVIASHSHRSTRKLPNSWKTLILR